MTTCRRPISDFPRVSPVALRYSVEETEDSFFLSILKRVPKDKLIDAVSREIETLKEKSYRPIYHIVRDMFGNPFYLEEEQNEDELIRKALSQLDLKALNQKVARELFQDHTIELNHRGDELTITSKKDGICKSFDIGEQIRDVRIIGCQLDDSNDCAILKLVLEKVTKAKDLVKLIKCSGVPAVNKLEQQRSTAKVDTEEQMRQEDLRMGDDERRQVESKKEAIRMEEERAMEQKKIAEQKMLAEAEKHHRIEEEKKELKLRKKAAKEKKYKEKKALLVAKKKAERLQKKSVQDATNQNTGTKTINININFRDQQTSKLLGNHTKEYNAPLRRLSSPILEDVEDEEIDRFHESLTRSPRGSAIIEDV